MKILLAVTLFTSLTLLALGSSVATAAPARSTRYALFRLDALGLAPEIAEQLEHILAIEIGHAVGSVLPPSSAVDAVLKSNPALANCTGDPKCLAPVAKALSVDRIVAGTAAGLGDSYIINLKLVDVKGIELGRVTATLHGRADQLIQEVRVAAYRLVAPARLTGAISLLSDAPGANVSIDGTSAGVTPLAAPIANLSVGEHQLRVSRAGYADFVDTVTVRFEKATEVVVHQQAVSLEARIEESERLVPPPPEPPYYARWWFWLGAASAATGVGLAAGAGIGGRGMQ